jgi:hypothetical protein
MLENEKRNRDAALETKGDAVSNPATETGSVHWPNEAAATALWAAYCH